MKQEQLQLASRIFSGVQDNYLPKLKSATSDEFFFKPGPKKWSAAQCLDHLNVINRKLAPEINRQFKTLESNNSAQTEKLSYTLMDSLMIWSMKSNFKIPAPGSYLPNPDSSKGAIISEYESFLNQWLDLIHDAKSLLIGKVTVKSPALPILNLSVLGWMVSTAYHNERHCKQALKAFEKLLI